MKTLITGVCGFVGSRLAEWIRQERSDWTVIGIDNLSRAGAETNRTRIQSLGVEFVHGDIRDRNDLELIPDVEAVIDASAMPSVLAGTDGGGASLQLMQHNLIGTLNLLEFCRSRSAKFNMISTSRVYAIKPLAGLPLTKQDEAYLPNFDEIKTAGLSELGVSEEFSTEAPVSLYGASKLASEVLAKEYAETFDFPVWINRCGVMAGAGQFGHPGQGIFAFWIHSHQQRQPLKYIGFDGTGAQVRDMLHPFDLARLVVKQFESDGDRDRPMLVNVSGGVESALSLAQLTQWCDQRFGEHFVGTDPNPRPFDLPWVVLDNSLAKKTWDWSPEWTREDILTEIADFAETRNDWLTISRGR
ncbi:NAD-dependent epimerase/dehydratase family protein [Thalassoglobus sp. JC818]|uniref:NAD-dependent epimerase/dehydratase family protein n=1 Tax=Thalassoglobus sp. JC818 TaxID=3232136 RepID=UPI00345A1603